MAGNIQMFVGSGKGKTSAAIGYGLRRVSQGKSVYLITFLKGKEQELPDYLKRLEPEMKVFSFEKFRECYNDLTEEEKQEEQAHMQNGMNYARKVLATEGCDVLILDEFLNLNSSRIISYEDMFSLLESVPDSMEVILTGEDRSERLWPYVNKVTEIITLKEREENEF